ncbi:PadR family transcriptional regulator [Sinomonas sp. JGH33]|uniref:PadR family transcriptional regulator n=1 Tax=Sinomonas terricola TaxID=3110330 RepID=A0ABU5T8W6_9MICC|nr:PadR family transcriptional regulator [Sinomonas sp. JGH33]MEA5455967.1 PadR family transcriptional regulator [Sinomonas sp. JGH33]
MHPHPDHHHEHQHHHDGRGFGPGGFGPGFGPGGFGRGFGRGFGPGRDFPPGFGPRGGRRASRGDIRAMILSLLSESPSTGYGIIQAANERTNGMWRPSPGSVYPTLQQLVDEELVEQTGEGKRTEFTLTEAGREYVADHAEELQKAWDAAPGRSEEADALVASAMKLMGVLKQFHFAATDEQRAKAAAALDEARKALYLILAE